MRSFVAMNRMFGVPFYKTHTVQCDYWQFGYFGALVHSLYCTVFSCNCSIG